MAVKFRIPIFLATLAACALSGAAYGAEFNERQRNEIGQIVRDYLLSNPEVLRDAFLELERRQRASEESQTELQISKNAAEIYHSSQDYVAGNPRGDVTLVEFFDYNCSYCQLSMPVVRKLIATDPNLRVVYKEFPILGPASIFAAKASIASMKQGKYLKLHEAMFEFKGTKDEGTVLEIAKTVGIDLNRLKDDMESPEVAAIINRNIKLAATINVTGTPGFIIGKKLIPGAVGFDILAGEVSKVRKDGGCATC